MRLPPRRAFVPRRSRVGEVTTNTTLRRTRVADMGGGPRGGVAETMTEPNDGTEQVVDLAACVEAGNAEAMLAAAREQAVAGCNLVARDTGDDGMDAGASAAEGLNTQPDGNDTDPEDMVRPPATPALPHTPAAVRQLRLLTSNPPTDEPL